jgi:hypothetical protein
MLAILSASQLLDDSAVPPTAAEGATDTATTVANSRNSARQLQLSTVSPSSCFKIDQAQLVHATVGEVAIHTLHVLHSSRQRAKSCLVYDLAAIVNTAVQTSVQLLLRTCAVA